MDSSHNKITVITCITGGKDNLRENLDIKRQSKAEWVAFMDKPTLSPTWTVKRAHNNFTDARRNSRIQKILPHLYCNSEYSIYTDGNIRLLKTPEELVEKYLKDADLAVFKHPNRDCIYDEATRCAVKHLDDPELIIEQAKYYEDNHFAKHKGLAECGIILRRHTAKVREFNDCWWSHFCRFSKRDQVSFMYAVDEVGIPINIIDEPFILRSDGTAERTGLAELTFHQHFT